MIDYNSDFGGPLGGVNFSASKLLSFTRKSSTLKWRNHEHECCRSVFWFKHLIVSEWLLLPAQPSLGGTETIRRSPRHIPEMGMNEFFRCYILPSRASSSAGTKVPSPWNHQCYIRTVYTIHIPRERRAHKQGNCPPRIQILCHPPYTREIGHEK